MRYPLQIRHRRPGGFTLIELLVSLAIVSMLVMIGLPELMSTIHRSKLEGAARSTASMMRSARFEAVKQATTVAVRVDTNTNEVMSFIDTSADGTFDAGERELGRFNLPAGLQFAGPGALTFSDGLANDGTAAWASFVSDGSVAVAGAVRFADERNNYLEVRVAPPASARVQLRKWDGAQWRYQGEGGDSWKWY